MEQKFDDAAINDIMSRHSDNWLVFRHSDGGFDILVNKGLQLCRHALDEIECTYDCRLEEVYTDRFCPEKEDCVIFSFARHNVEFRTLRMACGHVKDFDVTYQIEEKEYCEHCDKFVKVAKKMSTLNDDVVKMMK